MTNSRGQYKVNGGRKTVRQITLDDETADFLKAYGKGNLSLGVRMAAAFISDYQLVNGFPDPPETICHVI